MPTPLNILLYALGGGHGHALRGACLARRLAQRSQNVTLLVREENAALAKQYGPKVIALPRPTAADPRAELAGRLDEISTQLRPDLLILDTFPEGLMAELTKPLASRPALTLGLLRYRGDHESPTFSRACSRLDYALDLEPELEWLPPASNIEAFGPPNRFQPAPRSHQSNAPAVDVRILLGDRSHEEWAHRLQRRFQSRGISLTIHRPLLPQAEILDTEAHLHAKVIVGPAGFNLCYELLSLSIPHIAIPKAQGFDDQWYRAEKLGILASSPQEVELKILSRLRGDKRALPQLKLRSFEELGDRILELYRKKLAIQRPLRR